MGLKKTVLDYLESDKQFLNITAFATGLYPFFQYYSNNISEASSWQQLLFIISICIALPVMLMLIWRSIRKINFLKPFSRFGPSIINTTCFSVLIGFLLFNFNRKVLLAILVVSFLVSFILFRYLKKIVILQLVLAVVSIIGLVPKIIFALQHDNSTWAELSSKELNTTLLKTPNIFIIQPDGYANFSEMSQPPYSFDNSTFENWLYTQGFLNYRNFRSNYYSTYTSNASMFAMKHHYYSNTNRATLKTHGANEAIVGKYNNVLNILKRNNYKSHLITDNSYFLIDRKPTLYDYYNIKPSQLPFHDSGTVRGVDIQTDFAKVMDTLSGTKNFFFIEKTLPSHIMYTKSYSKGKDIERIEYLDRVKTANEWIKSLVYKINKFDEEALIVIVADHGGLVGLDYTLEAVNRKLDTLETISTFSSMLSIKWPKQMSSSNLNYSSNVNLFRNIFYVLSKNENLIDSYKENSSFLPLKENGNASYYEYIDDKGNFVFNEVSD
jgi:hypothetical protein